MMDDTELGLVDDVNGKTILEIGCAKGTGLANLAARGAGRIIGTDISSEQLKYAEQNPMLEKAEFILSPMERDLGEKNFADFTLSLYSIGYSSDIENTLKLFNQYTKNGRKLILSWIHPMYSCLSIEDGKVVMNDSYFNEGPSLALKGEDDIPLIQERFKQSTLIQKLFKAGFAVNDIIETDPTQEPGMHVGKFYAKNKAHKCPNTLLISATKFRELDDELAK